MKSYNFFANLYDCLTDNVDYQVRSDYISDFFIENNITNGTIIDLACGTGSMSVPLAKKGYNIVGIDLSEEMLSIASQKAFQCGCNISFFKSKMQNFSLPQLADGCICCLDSINHLTYEDDVIKTFSCVYNSLKPGALFVFDVNTVYKHQNILFNNTFVFEEDDFYLVWDNEQVDDFEVRILLDMFLYNGKNYDRYSEEFNERAYPLEFYKESLNKIGFNILGVYDELTKNNPKADSQRIYFVCKKV